MAKLLHIDSSIRRSESVSRAVTAAFAASWREANPDGDVVYRDLAAEPVPHLSGSGFGAAFVPADEHTLDQAAAWAPRRQLIDELLAADTVVLGVPMHNFSVPDRFKSWLDTVISPLTLPDHETGEKPLAGKRIVVVQSRGGAYGPGTPREDYDFQERYLRKVFDFLGVLDDVSFVAAEMTMAGANPALAQFKDIQEQSLAEAHRAVHALARS